jgi:hypothetical protein
MHMGTMPTLGRHRVLYLPNTRRPVVLRNPPCLLSLLRASGPEYTTCPKLRRIHWYTGGLVDENLGLVIGRNRSQVTWSLLKILRGAEGSVYTGWVRGVVVDF